MSWVSRVTMATYDLKITGGTVIDGSGRAGFVADLAIRDGSIAAIGASSGSAYRELDARGLIVAPGFVDVHTHYDAQILWDRRLSISPWHGVTTAVMGNCGFGIAPTRPEHRDLILETLKVVEGMSLPALQAGLGRDWPFISFPDYLAALERRGVAINVGALVGHTPLRLFVMGPEAATRAASASEIAQMCALLREALGAGALGLGTSRGATHNGFRGLPVPSRVADVEELRALARVLGEFAGPILQIARANAAYLELMAELGTLSKGTVTYAALFADSESQGPPQPIQKRIAEINAGGSRIVPQVSCRPVMFDYDFREPFMLGWAPCVAALGRLSFEERRAAYADGAFRRELAATLQAQRPAFLRNTRLSHIPIEGGGELLDRSVEEEAGRRGVAPLDFLLDLALATNLELRVCTAVANSDESRVSELLRDRGALVALSDAGAHANQICDACYPTYLLGHWVRDRRAVTIEEGVRLLTSRPAEVFALAGRGLLAQGYAADIVVFDADTVAAGPLVRVNDLPGGAERLISEGRGIKAVIVNGKVLRQDGVDVDDPHQPLPGRLLRRNGATGGAQPQSNTGR
jgi:N-acyl-D-aspartate/D-glutamate deacylase